MNYMKRLNTRTLSMILNLDAPRKGEFREECGKLDFQDNNLYCHQFKGYPDIGAEIHEFNANFNSSKSWY